MQIACLINEKKIFSKKMQAKKLLDIARDRRKILRKRKKKGK